MARHILEQHKATHKTRNSTSDNQLYQYYRILKKLLKFFYQLQMQKPSGKMVQWLEEVRKY
jgi:hypothetical protein